MLKFWLTWLQPSLGFLGIALLLSAPLSSTATPKPTGAATAKTPKQQQQVKIAPASTIDRVLKLSEVSVTPDFAVRQLAIDTMAKSGAKADSVAVQSPQFNNNNALASFVSPTERLPNVSAKSTKIEPQVVKNSVTTAVTKSTQPRAAAPIVPGLFIGTSEVRLSSKFLPKTQPQPSFLTGKLVASTVPTAGMFSTAIADPFPVVLPQRMQALKLNPGIENVPILQAKSPTTDPIASIPAGLQRLLGNEPTVQPTVKLAAPVAKATERTTNPTIALSQLIAPETTTAASTVARGASLQLTTAQVYASVPKFDIPGAPISNRTPAPQIQTAKATTSVMAIKPVRNNLATAVTQRKSNYVALMSDRFLIPVQHPWSTVRQGNSLGGLILGSQPRTDVSPMAFLSTTIMPKGLTVFNPSGVN